MAWLFGILFFATVALWVARERRLRRVVGKAEASLDEIAKGGEDPDLRWAKSAGGIGARFVNIRESVLDAIRLRKLAEANLQIILSSMEEGVLVADSRRTVRMVNPAARRLFSLPEDVTGVPVVEALREPEVDSMIISALKSGASQEREVESGGRSSSVLAVRVSPIRDASGEPGALVMFRDLTRLTKLETIRRQFVANVSHELRTPLAIFQGYVENLQDAPDMPREQQIESFAVLAKHSSRLNALVEDLLVLARLEARSEELEIVPVGVADFFKELERDWALLVKERGVTMRLDLAENIPVLNADRMRLEQVFNNLLENALKYTPAGGEITLGAKAAGPDVELWVKDTGQGILSTEIAHIFERFYRADKARSRDLGGTGLGLSIVKHIAQAHGGSVAAESVYGKGTKILVGIPAAGPAVREDASGNPDRGGI